MKTLENDDTDCPFVHYGKKLLIMSTFLDGNELYGNPEAAVFKSLGVIAPRLLNSK